MPILVRNALISVDVGSWRAEMSAQSKWLEYTNKDGLATITLPDLTGPEQAKRFLPIGKPGGWAVKVWLVTDKCGAYACAAERPAVRRICANSLRETTIGAT